MAEVRSLAVALVTGLAVVIDKRAWSLAKRNTIQEMRISRHRIPAGAARLPLGLEVSQHQMPLYQAVPSLCMCVTCRAYMLTWTECVLVYKSARRDVAWPHSALTRPRHHSGRDHAPSPPIRPSDPPRGAPRNRRVPAESACAHIRRPAMRGRGCRPSHRPSSALAPASR